jgi:hypothetical protein
MPEHGECGLHMTLEPGLVALLKSRRNLVDAWNMLVIRAAMVAAGLLIAASSLVFAVFGVPVIFEPEEGADTGGQIVLAAVVAVLLAGGPYVAYLFIRSALRIPKVADSNRRRVVQIWLLWLAWSAVSFMTVPFEFPAGVGVIFGIALFVIALASLAEGLEPRPQRPERK